MLSIHSLTVRALAILTYLLLVIVKHAYDRDIHTMYYSWCIVTCIIYCDHLCFFSIEKKKQNRAFYRYFAVKILFEITLSVRRRIQIQESLGNYVPCRREPLLWIARRSVCNSSESKRWVRGWPKKVGIVQIYGIDCYRMIFRMISFALSAASIR